MVIPHKLDDRFGGMIGAIHPYFQHDVGSSAICEFKLEWCAFTEKLEDMLPVVS